MFSEAGWDPVHEGSLFVNSIDQIGRHVCRMWSTMLMNSRCPLYILSLCLISLNPEPAWSGVLVPLLIKQEKIISQSCTWRTTYFTKFPDKLHQHS